MGCKDENYLIQGQARGEFKTKRALNRQNFYTINKKRLNYSA
jgi:hypothetical protein